MSSRALLTEPFLPRSQILMDHFQGPMWAGLVTCIPERIECGCSFSLAVNSKSGKTHPYSPSARPSPQGFPTGAR
ncbi:MAG: hypothetical protein R6U57_03820 [Anaerolineales bacterium]